MIKPDIQYSTHTNCHNCSLSDLCLPFSLNDNELDQLDQLIKRKKPIQKGQTLYSSGDNAQSLFAIRSGAFKSYTVTNEGVEVVNGFHIAGDVLGFDALGNDKYPGYAQAIETSMLCEIPFTVLDDLSGQFPKLKRQLMKLMSSQITHIQERVFFLNQKNAEARLASFLYVYGQRLSARGQSANKFLLVMSRADLGSYIDIRIETISRLLGQFQRDGILSVDGKNITILDIKKLAELGACER